MRRPPEEIDTGSVVLRRWRAVWAPDVAAAVQASLPELRAFMGWASEDYGLRQAGEFIRDSMQAWTEGSAFGYAVQTRAGDVIGSGSLMTRMGEGVLEVGYWIHSAHTGRGYATAVTKALTSVALGMDGVEKVALRLDAANRASARVAEKAGFVEVERRPTTLEPAEERTDVELVWELRAPP